MSASDERPNYSRQRSKLTLILLSRVSLPTLFLLLCLSLLSTSSALNAQDTPPPQPKGPLTCLVCGKTPLVGKYWLHKLGSICEDCHSLPTRCAHCHLPVKDGFVKTSDGRLYCKLDHPRLVFSTNEAARIFTESVEAITRHTASAMALRQPSITVSLFDVDYWNPRDTPTELRRQGFSTTRRVGRDFSHTVVLLSGQPRDEMSSVCAHEFTHLWINENKADGRVIDPDTIEAICELIPYKLALAARDTNQQHAIRVNPYTRGMITNLIAFEAQHGLEAVLDWVKQGKGDKLDSEQIAMANSRLSNLRATPSAPVELPTDIALTGLAGSSTRRLAMVNGTIIRQGERKRIQLKDRSVSVRCLEIKADSIVVSVDDKPETRTLRLEGK